MGYPIINRTFTDQPLGALARIGNLGSGLTFDRDALPPAMLARMTPTRDFGSDDVVDAVGDSFVARSVVTSGASPEPVVPFQVVFLGLEAAAAGCTLGQSNTSTVKLLDSISDLVTEAGWNPLTDQLALRRASVRVVLAGDDTLLPLAVDGVSLKLEGPRGPLLQRLRIDGGQLVPVAAPQGGRWMGTASDWSSVTVIGEVPQLDAILSAMYETPPTDIGVVVQLEFVAVP